MLQRVTEEDFARSFGTNVDDLSGACRELIANTDFQYEVLQGAERDRVLLDVLRKIETDHQRIGAEERRDTWERGWTENLQAFSESGYDLKSLVPRFLRPGQIIRLNGNFIKPNNPTFELDYFYVFCQWLFHKYLADAGAIYEFGCGTGMNLVTIARMFPSKEIHGLDFVPSSRDLVNKIGEVYGWNITGHLFDMVEPDENLELGENSAILTFGSIEQLAGKLDEFVKFLLKRSPKLCISLEPTIELYDESNLLDYLAIKFHRKRGYTQNYLTRLRELENSGAVEILKAKRLFFGSLYMEGYSCMIWRPRKVVR